MSDSHGKCSRLLAAFLVAMAIANSIALWRARDRWLRGYGDFAAFYTAGSLVRRGLGPQLYDPGAQWKVQQEFASDVEIRRGPIPFIRPPFEALLFAPLTLCSYPAAILLWSAAKLALLIFLPFVVLTEGQWRESFPPWMTGLLAFGTFPVFIDFLQGQDSVLYAFLFAVAFRQLAAGRDSGAGLALGLALFKFHLVIPFVFMLWIAGRKRIMPAFLATAAGLVGVSAWMIGWNRLFRYPAYLLALNRSEGAGFVTAESQMNLRGLLTLGVGRSVYPGQIHWVLLPIGLAAAVYVGLLWRRAAPEGLSPGFGLAAVTAILTSYYAYSYDLIAGIVPLLAVREQEVQQGDRRSRFLAIAGAGLLLCTPVYWFLRLKLQSEFLMTVPLLAVALDLGRRLRQTGRS